MNTVGRCSRAADHLPIPPRANSAASAYEERIAADHDSATLATLTHRNGVDTSREVSEDENTLDFEAAIWFG
jgi:hypothetical protein